MNKLWNLFGAILNDSWWLAKNSEIYLGWLLVILNYLLVICKNWNLFGWFLMIFDDFQWFIKFWNLFGTILGDAWWLAKSSDIYLYWISVILDDSWWFTKKLWNLFGVIFCYFEVFICDSWKTLKFIWDDSQWFSMLCEKLWNLFLVILCDFWWFSMIHQNSKIYLGQFLMIFDDSQKVWNSFGTILWDFWWILAIICDSQKTLKFIWSDCRWFSMILNDSWWFTKKLWNLFWAILSDSHWF